MQDVRARRVAAPAWIALFAAALLSPGRASAQDEPTDPLPTVNVELDGWYAAASGWIFITRGSQPGSATRAREGRNFDLDPEVLPVGEAWLRFWGPSSVGFRIVPTEESGTRTTSEDFIYHGMTYAAGREVHADVGFLLADVDYRYRAELSEVLTLTPHLGVEYWGFTSHLRTTDPLPPIDENRRFSSGYWLAGADLEARISGPLVARASLLGGITGSDRYFVEAQAGLALTLGSGFSVTVDFRVHDVRFHTSTNEADLLFYGPSVGAQVRF
jgi:hypothetical protein